MKTRPIAVLAATVMALAVLLLAGGPAANAHEGSGVVTLESAEPEGTSVTYTVRVVWQNDGHPAEDATVTATPVQPDGTPLTPVTLSPDPAGDGRYTAAVDFPDPGTWTVRFTSIEPTGTAESPQEIAAPAATTTEATTTTEAPADEPATTAADADDQAAASTDDDGGTPGWVAPVVAVLVLASGGLLVWRLARRNRPRPDDTATAPEPDEQPQPT